MKSGTPTATTVPEMRQKKNNPKLRYITCSYMRFFILRTPLRFGENTLKKAYNQIMYNSLTKSTLCPATLPEKPQYFPTTHQWLKWKKIGRVLFPCACGRFILFTHSVSGDAVRASLRGHPSLHCVQFISPTSAPHCISAFFIPLHKSTQSFHCAFRL